MSFRASALRTTTSRQGPSYRAAGGPALPPAHRAREGGAGPLAQGRQHRRPLGGKGERGMGAGLRHERRARPPALPSVPSSSGRSVRKVSRPCAGLRPKSQLSGLAQATRPESVDGTRLEGPLDLHLPRSHSISRRISCSGSRAGVFSSSEATGMRSVRTSMPEPVIEAGLEHIGVLDVAALGLEGPDRRDAPVPGAGSRSAPKSEGLSNRGQQSQSIEPSRPTRAADRPSPMAA